MRMPRYSLRTLIALVRVLALLLGCWFAGWCEPLIMALALQRDQWNVQYENVPLRNGRGEQRVRCYVIDPAAFQLSSRNVSGEERIITLKGRRVGPLGIRMLNIRLAVIDGQL